MNLMIVDTQTGYWRCPNCDEVNRTSAGIEAAYCGKCLAIVLLDDIDEHGRPQAILTGCEMAPKPLPNYLNGGTPT